ncbi:unnamed protein product [Schistosoma mattheei]|uniref:Uncharacterized protein n=1 Tax=Schistosoma mattheei TaxID=31246 RepID=A0A183NDP8_9TREM|nr:unnamed protein product [Schistosoma mattheei]
MDGLDALDDLDFADNLIILSRTHQIMQIMTNSLAAASASEGLNIHKAGSEILKYSTEDTNPIALVEETPEEVKKFTYLGSITDEQGGSDEGVMRGLIK